MSDLHLSPEPVQGLLRFSHQAMATTFEVLVCHPKPVYARQAANEAFALLDRLEQHLSRFVENSDVSRVNASKAGDPVLVGPETFECLRQARAAWDLTGGAFDVTVGTWTRLVEGRTPVHATGGMDLVLLDESTLTVTRPSEDMQLDLGGIGKGFALDQMARTLEQWGIRTALLHGGASTVLALDAPPGTKGWPVTASCPFEPTKVLAHVELRHAASSGSAQIERRHILDPRTGGPATGAVTAWSCAASGALADALSTAFMVLELDRVTDLCHKDVTIGAWVVRRGSSEGRPTCQAIPLGHWPGVDQQSCQCP